MRRCLPLVVVTAAMSFSVPALAQSTTCPPGSWFCADAQIAVPGPSVRPQAPQTPAVAPPVVDEPAPAPPVIRRRPATQVEVAPGAAPPPVVVYQPVPAAPPPQVIVVTPGYGYGSSYSYRPRPPVITAPPAPRWHSEFGINLRVEGAALGKPAGAQYSAGMGGVGLSLRYRPTPHFAFDLGADVLAGTDYNGFQRTEVPISLSGMLYVNPRSRVQFYLLGGANFSRAEVRSDNQSQLLHPVDGNQYGATYTYFGGQGGGGFEFRFSRRVAVNIDALGFVRKRIGDVSTPEFVDPQTGNTSNVSGGALFRGGLTFWW